MGSYEVLKNRLSNEKPFDKETAIERINSLADQLIINQSQVEELLLLVEQNGDTGSELILRIEKIEKTIDNLLGLESEV